MDLARGLLTVQAAYAKNGQTRNIPLNSRAKAAFHQLKKISRSEYVFSKPNGLPYKSIEKPFLKACQAAGLSGTGVSLHTLRHTFASNLVMASVDLLTVQQYGGWADLSRSTLCASQREAQGEGYRNDRRIISQRYSQQPGFWPCR